ncbi:MAG: cytochrome P460 family protein [Candidatus Poribacteria bacterium]|nr:cytochrome P460 family protein [Candidatus Poribacteria bacterium]
MKPVLLPELSAPSIRIEITPTKNGNLGHGSGTRSVYINGIGVAALKDNTLKTFPIGTLIIKEVNDNTNTFVQHVASMKKTDDPAYATHNGWLYTQHTRQTESAKFIAVGGDVPGSTSESCHACHAQAPKDSVFTQLPTPDAAVEEVPLPTEPEPESEPTQEQPQETEETQTPEETENGPLHGGDGPTI